MGGLSNSEERDARRPKVCVWIVFCEEEKIQVTDGGGTYDSEFGVDLKLRARFQGDDVKWIA